MENRVVIVTGAASGIGLATVTRFVREGHAVSGLDVKEPEKKPTGLYEHYRCDVSDEEQVKRAVQQVVDRHERIDVLVNVAGIVLVKPIEETLWEEFSRIVNVNLGGAFLLIKHVLPIFKSQRRGVIVNVGSVSGHVGQINHSLYGATKSGVIALCHSLAWELAPYRIRINSVSPGSVDTAMLRSDVQGEAKRSGRAFEEIKKEREAEQAIGRWADPSEIAEVIWFLSGDGSSFINGTDILVDAGWVAK